jgi:hypothetical protein
MLTTDVIVFVIHIWQSIIPFTVNFFTKLNCLTTERIIFEDELERTRSTG